MDISVKDEIAKLDKLIKLIPQTLEVSSRPAGMDPKLEVMLPVTVAQQQALDSRQHARTPHQFPSKRLEETQHQSQIS